MTNQQIIEITERIIQRSKSTRTVYLEQMRTQFHKEYSRERLNCGNLAHAFAGCNNADKSDLSIAKVPNLAIVTAYNDMPSAHNSTAGSRLIGNVFQQDRVEGEFAFSGLLSRLTF